MARAQTHVFVMAGGSGTRLWPFGRRNRPKQCLPMPDGPCLLARAVERARALPGARVRAVAPVRLVPLVAESGGLEESEILAEPEGRDTAACVTLALASLADRPNEDVVLFLPADHDAEPDEAFRSALARAVEGASTGERIWLVGIAPDRPATGYGWFARGPSLPGGGFEAGPFVEKPDRATAKKLLAGGRHLWNGGVLAARLDVLRAALAEHAPVFAEGLRNLAACRDHERAAVFARLPRTSIDRALLEKGPALAAVEASCRWRDVGDFQALAALVPADRDGNRCFAPGPGAVAFAESRDSFALVEGDERVVLFGVEGLAVVRAQGVTLVMPLNKAAELRALHARLGDLGLEDLA